MLRDVERDRVALALVRAALPRGRQIVLAAEALAGRASPSSIGSRMPSLAKCGTSTVWISARSGPSSGRHRDLELRVEIGPRDALLLDRDAGLPGELVDQLVHDLAVGAGEAVPVGDGRLRLRGGARRGPSGQRRPAAAVPIRKRAAAHVTCRASLMTSSLWLDGSIALSAQPSTCNAPRDNRAAALSRVRSTAPSRAERSLMARIGIDLGTAHRHRRPAHLRQLHRAPRPLHLRRHLRRGLAAQRRARLPPRRARRGPAAAHARAPLAGRQLRERLSLARRRRARGPSARGAASWPGTPRSRTASAPTSSSSTAASSAPSRSSA